MPQIKENIFKYSSYKEFLIKALSEESSGTRSQLAQHLNDGPIADRVFKAEEELPKKPFEVLAGDITYLRLGSSFLYLAVVIDLYNREVVGWSMSHSLESTIVVDAMKMALKKCNSETKFVFHSDRGSQYASEVFRELLGNKKLTPSMSRKGNCYDNCHVESWFKSLKSEWIYRHQ